MKQALKWVKGIFEIDLKSQPHFKHFYKCYRLERSKDFYETNR